MISLALPSGQVGLKVIAEQMQMHPRKLQRQLQQQDLSLQMLVDEVRKVHAEHLLSETQYDLLTISSMLDLRYQSQLSAKANGWFGMSAAAYRQKKAHQKVG